jgi:hypothetical protein
LADVGLASMRALPLNAGFVAVGVGFYAEDAFGSQRDLTLRRLHAIQIALLEDADTDVQRAALQIHDGLFVVQHLDVEHGVVIDARGGGPDAELGASAGLGPERVLRRHGKVDAGGLPAFLLVPEERNGTAQVAHAAHAAGRIGEDGG